MISIPKSGTHLCVKLLNMLTGKNQNALNSSIDINDNNYQNFEKIILSLKQNNQYAYNHTSTDYIGNHFILFGQLHPEYVKILQIRDLRDVIVSYIYHQGSNEIINNEMGGQYSIDEQLTHILSLQNSPWGQELKKHISDACAWLSDPNTVILRFEDVVGEEGGGSLKKQRDSIRKLAQQLNIPLSSKNNNQLNIITTNLFGNTNGPQVSPTFRQGKIGSWKTHFKPHHLKLFQKNWGIYQTTLEYPLN